MGSIEETRATMDRMGARGEAFVFVIDFDMAAPVVCPPEKAGELGIFFDFNGKSSLPPAAHDPVAPGLRKHPVAFGEYKKAYDLVKSELEQGNSYLLNLTFPTPIETGLSLGEIFSVCRAKYRMLFGDRFVFFSPETFVTIASGVITSCPMKGTIDAALPDAERLLMDNPKEVAEHNTIVDLLRNDIGIVARDVRVEEFRYVERITAGGRDLLQTSSRITGRLPGDYKDRLGSILFSMLPAGSVTGAPKKKTVEIISRAEPLPRGYFTGVAGYFDGETLDSCVMIRFIEKTPPGLVYRSGGGITVRSDPESEYREMIDKVYVPVV